MKITETPNDLPNINPVRERMDIYVPDVNKHIPHRRGFVYGMIGSGGSGKTSLLLSMFKHREYYRSKFDNIYLFIPESSYLSVTKHPFKDHTNIYHELTIDDLEDIYDELIYLKEEAIREDWPIETSLIIIDDMANNLKNNELVKQLNKMIIKSRHLSVCWIFTLQSYNLMNLTIRKQFTNLSIFKPKNNKELVAISSEVINMNRDSTIKLFDYVFSEPYSHLDVDTFTGQLYKNFNPLSIEDKEDCIKRETYEEKVKRLKKEKQEKETNDEEK